MTTPNSDALNRVSRIEIIDLQNYQFVLDSHEPGQQSAIEISGKLADELKTETIPAGDHTTLILRGTAGPSAQRPAFKNIQGTYITGTGSIGGTMQPLQISTGGPGGAHGRVRVLLPPGRAVTVVAPGFGTMSTATPQAPSARKAHQEEAERVGAKVKKDLSGLQDKIEAEVAAALRKAGLPTNDDD